jgi:hypothetical protein
MPPSKPLVPFPMHSFGPWRKIINHAEATAKQPADLLRFHEVTDARRRLSCCVGESVAMPTAPRPTARSVQFFYHPPAIARKIRPLPPKMRRDLHHLKRLVRELNPVVFHISRASERADVDAPRLLYRPASAARPFGER